MTEKLDTSPAQADTSSHVKRERLRSKVAHAAEMLHEQGPIGTFIHTNPLHSLEHLHFEQAVAEAERLTGGHAYLPNDEFRRLYRTGRITDQDLQDALISHQSNEDPEHLVRIDGSVVSDHERLRIFVRLVRDQRVL